MNNQKLFKQKPLSLKVAYSIYIKVSKCLYGWFADVYSEKHKMCVSVWKREQVSKWEFGFLSHDSAKN